MRPFLSGPAMSCALISGRLVTCRVEGELLESSQPVLATLEFDDHCIRETANGRLVPSRRRRLRIAMRVAIEPDARHRLRGVRG